MSPAESYQVVRYKKMSYSEEWHSMMALRVFAAKFKSAGLRLQHPEWSESVIKHHVKEILFSLRLFHNRLSCYYTLWRTPTNP